MKTHSKDNRSGGVLVMAMLVMIVFSTLAIGLFKLHETDAVEAVYVKQSKQAFWLAEAGLQDAIQQLSFYSNFHSSAVSSDQFYSKPASGEPRYDVSVIRTAYDPSTAFADFEITSTGWVGHGGTNINRRVRLAVSTRPGSKYPIIGAGGTVNIAQNTYVPSPISVIDGATLIIDDKIPPGQNQEGDFDIVILDTEDGSVVDAKKSGATEGEHYAIVDLPPPTLPTMPDDLVPSVAIPPVGSVGFTNSAPGDINISTGTTNVYGVSMLTVGNISGGGTLANTNSINITGNISDGVTVVANGGITISANAVLGANVTLLAEGSITVGSGFDFSTNVFIATEGDVSIGDSGSTVMGLAVRANGFVFIGNSIHFGPEVDIRSGADLDVGHDCFFDADTLLYAWNTLTVDHHCTILPKSFLLADGGDDGVANIDIILGGHSQIFGLIFADEGIVDIEQGSNGSETRVTGSVIGGEGVNLGQNSEVFFDPEVFDHDNDFGIDLSDLFRGEVTTTKHIWMELPPL